MGQAGVDHHLKHDSDEPVTRVQFLINEGGYVFLSPIYRIKKSFYRLITILNDDSIHLWNFRQKTPEIVHSIQLNRERISAIHLPLQSRWLYVGTDKGNVYFVCLATFELSTYVINWNKAVDLSCRVHPGPIRLLSVKLNLIKKCIYLHRLLKVSTSEPSKLLIVFKKGSIKLQ